MAIILAIVRTPSHTAEPVYRELWPKSTVSDTL
jgi:hypothetical protein